MPLVDVGNTLRERIQRMVHATTRNVHFFAQNQKKVFIKQALSFLKCIENDTRDIEMTPTHKQLGREGLNM